MLRSRISRCRKAVNKTAAVSSLLPGLVYVNPSSSLSLAPNHNPRAPFGRSMLLRPRCHPLVGITLRSRSPLYRETVKDTVSSLYFLVYVSPSSSLSLAPNHNLIAPFGRSMLLRPRRHPLVGIVLRSESSLHRKAVNHTVSGILSSVYQP